jgi:hypothetical protein
LVARACGGIVAAVRSVADTLRAADAAETLRLTPAERLRRALALGERDLRAYQLARGIDRAAALRELRARRQAGRVRSACASETSG